MSAPNYKKPPITEAVIGINFSSNIEPSKLKSVSTKLSKFYPNIQALTDVKVSVHINDNINDLGTETSTKEFFRLSSRDQTEIAVLTGESILFSRLAPYTGWDEFFTRFKRDWSTFKRVVGFQELARIGVRYINRIDLPIVEGKVEHEHYLNVFPNLPTSLSNISAYAMQTGIELDSIGCKLLINSAVVDSPVFGNFSYILDFDIFKDHDVQQNDREIFALLESIRDEKNRIFEECITDKARYRFNNDD